MRLDLFLKLSRLISSRTLAKEFTKAGLVRVNGVAAKSSREIKTADEIEITRHTLVTKLRVLTIPDKKQVSKRDAAGLYQVLSESVLEDDDSEGF